MASDIYPSPGLKEWGESLFTLVESQCRECQLPASFICRAIATAHSAAKVPPLENQYRVMEHAQEEIISEFGEGRSSPCMGLQDAYYASPGSNSKVCQSTPVTPMPADSLG